MINDFCLTADRTLREAMTCINDTAKGIALVVDSQRRLLFTITDGDLRRVVLNGLSLDLTVADWAAKRPEHGNLAPTTAPFGTPREELLRLMHYNSLRHIPLVDAEGRVAHLVLINELLGQEGEMDAVVMAGGFGTRLRPLTDNIPKPMLPIGDRPLMEHIVRQLRDSGIRHLNISTHYMPEVIHQHFGNGDTFGVAINYVNEERPLGTAGALGLMQRWSSTLLVVNGDILTKLNYRSMLTFHKETNALMTVGVRKYEHQVPYGVIETDGERIKGITEKPTLSFFVNAGVYLLEPDVFDIISSATSLDMTDLMTKLIAQKKEIVSFPISEYWMDIGQMVDYERAQHDFAKV